MILSNINIYNYVIKNSNLLLVNSKASYNVKELGKYQERLSMLVLLEAKDSCWLVLIDFLFGS